MKTLDPAALSRSERYRLLIGSIVPRPIAWILTRDGGGVINLAPFSYFMGVTSTPASLAVSIGARQPEKDTLRNLRTTREAVVHAVPADRLDAVNQTGAEYAHHVSETELLDLPTIASDRVTPPRLEFADVALECRLLHEFPVGSPGASICVLEVVLAHVSERVAGADGVPDPHRLRTVARLGERCYLEGRHWSVVERPRPDVPDDLSLG